MRNNTLVPGGRLYKDDPVVLAWELQNEPQLREGYEKCDTLQPSLLPWLVNWFARAAAARGLRTVRLALWA